MSYVIGRGRNAREAYPISPGAGGGGQAVVAPLTRQRFIDGGTTQLGLDGSVANPFKTIAEFTASRTNVSVADATANYVGWLMPAIGGYVENIAFPPYASTEVRADSLANSVVGVNVTGNVTWANVAGAFAATVAGVSLHNVSVSGNITVTDDAGAPGSIFSISGDEVGHQAVTVGGVFDSSTTTHLVFATFTDINIAGITAGTGASSAIVLIFSTTCTGAITARSLVVEDSIISSSAITTREAAAFTNCSFSAGSNTVLTVPGGAAFDGLSWVTFIEAGGTRAPGDAGTTVLVYGGYLGSPVEGAALTGAATNVSLNGTGASVGFQGANSGNHYTTSNGTPTSVTLLTGGGELAGDTMRITKTDLGANALAVINGGGGGGTIGTIPANNRGSVLARFNGTNWIFVDGGALAA